MAGSKIASRGTGSNQTYADFKQLLDLDNNEFFKPFPSDHATSSISYTVQTSSTVVVNSRATGTHTLVTGGDSGYKSGTSGLNGSDVSDAVDEKIADCNPAHSHEVEELSLEWHGADGLDDGLGDLANLMDRPTGVRMPKMGNFIEENDCEEDDPDDEACIKSFVSEFMTSDGHDDIARPSERPLLNCSIIPSEASKVFSTTTLDLNSITITRKKSNVDVENAATTVKSREQINTLSVASMVHNATIGNADTSNRTAHVITQQVDSDDLNPGEADWVDGKETPAVRRQRQLDYVAVASDHKSHTSVVSSRARDLKESEIDRVLPFKLDISHNYDEVVLTERNAPWE